MAKKAKKSAKKAARQTGKKSAKGAPKKAGKKTGKKSGKKAGKSRANELAPRPMSTGKGPGPAEIGADFVAMVNAGKKEEEIWAKWFSPKLVSIEGGQMNMAWHGMKAVKAKSDWWYSSHRVHSITADGPYVGATGFGVRFHIDAEELASGKRWEGDELAFYSVLKGKVVQEEFMGKPMPS